MPRSTQRPSLSNLRTHTTRRTSSSLARHELFMKLTSLEIERSRRSTERQATVERIRKLDERLHAIDAEQAEVRQLLEGTPPSAVAKRGAASTMSHFNY